ncbi:DNA-3-methyladenine glycosylase I [Alkalimarinus sediminis]|uniref:DNA-3-methyladenine glycosylase I n=1 Tax=Alkalimarinus sediminis TaxID=1632866 RepID=A0A9E8KQZ0_9ALTE|nr:DNA-3-methyladenine glycosylase I [Alkalimarinus sediminis]UZW76414.1 DNA-3-methyladenine glycosylase I [Alkalimarinus sediminis]
MNVFDQIYDAALRKFNSVEALEATMPTILDANQLKAQSNEFYLSAMTQRIFQAGMTHSVINSKWPHFENVFWGFDPKKLVLIDDAFMERAMQDKGLIRHWGKLQTIPVNALEMNDLTSDGTRFGEIIAEWDQDITQLWRFISKRFKRMGGQSTPYFLRMVGKDTFVLTNDVVQKLLVMNVIDSNPTSKADIQTVSDFFSGLKADSGRPLAHISKLMALSLE